MLRIFVARRAGAWRYGLTPLRAGCTVGGFRPTALQIQEELVRSMKLTAGMGVFLLGAISAAAQAPAPKAEITSLEFQTPKNGMVQQYEAGRKQKVEWHKQQKDKDALYVFETLTGDRTGTYLVGRLGQHWADMDTPSVTDAADLAEYQKAVGASVDKVVSAYYEYMPKVSNPPTEMNGKYTEIITFHIRYGHNDDFRSAIARVHDARMQLKSPFHYNWYHLLSGGSGGTFVLTIEHANWASFEDDPAVKPLRDDLRAAFGEQEAMSVIERINSSVESTYDELIEFRPDLSYMPAK
jgi:hypothetical protein